MRDCFVIFDNLIKDGIIARSTDGDKKIYKASSPNELLKGRKYVYTSGKLNTSSLPSISVFLCQVISVYGISLSLKTLVSLQLYCFPPIPLTKKDISDNLSDLIDRGLLAYDKVSDSYYFASPLAREQFFLL